MSITITFAFYFINYVPPSKVDDFLFFFHIFNRNFICYVCQVIFSCKKVIFQKKRPLNFAFLLLITCEITILFLQILPIFTNLFATLFITSCYISDPVSLGQWRAVIVAFNCGSSFTINNHIISLRGSLYMPCLSVFCPNISVFSY